MPTPGILMRLSDAPNIPLNLPASVKVEASYALEADDNKTPSLNTLYFLADIEPLLTSEAPYKVDVAAHAQASTSTTTSWVLASFINARNPGSTSAFTQTQLLPAPPSPSSVLVINGSTPRPEYEADYHAWYDEEHGGKLTLVPGWFASRRYKLAKVYGETETANFYGVNFYEKENGLGGPEWKAGVTEWTLRIRKQAARENVRRVWRVAADQ
ncbi:hypothetical protein BJX70DRAFT_396340 [Aspergillus crustosus]